MPYPPLLPVADIQERLLAIFPDGTTNRNYVTREIAAKTIFVMLYIGAVESAGSWLRPDQVTRMTDAQALLAEEDARVWCSSGALPRKRSGCRIWCAPNGRGKEAA